MDTVLKVWPLFLELDWKLLLGVLFCEIFAELRQVLLDGLPPFDI